MKILKIFSHITKMITATGKMRIFYAFVNVILVLIAFAAGYGIYFFVNHIGDSIGYFIGGIIGIIFCFGVAVTSFLQGAIAEIVLTIMSFIGTFVSKERLNNFIAFSLTIIIYIIVIIVINLLI